VTRKIPKKKVKTALTWAIIAFFSLVSGGYCSFDRGKPVSLANRAPSWIFEARAPGYERVSAKIERGGVGCVSFRSLC